jgi:signal peptidase
MNERYNMKEAIIVPTSILIVYLLVSLFIPVFSSGEQIFVVDSMLWAALLVMVLLFSKFSHITILQTEKTVISLAIIVAVFQIFLNVFLGFFMGFGKNSNVWTPYAFAIYFPYLLMPILATEISRAFLIQTVRRKPTLALFFISVFFALIITSAQTYTRLATPLAIAEFSIKTFIPTLSISLLASYLAFLGGFPANLTFMAIPTLFTWFSPILPNLQWQALSLLTVTAAGIGFLVLDTAVKPLPSKRIHRTLRKPKSQLPYWAVIALIGLIAVWSSTGLLGFTPSIIASGSMRPTLDVGDIAITVQTRPENIKVGDVIQYWREGESAPIIHRVIETYKSGGTTYITTKGDANNAPDDPVTPTQTVGKLIITIPKLGWISIYLKTFIANAWAFFTNNPAITYTTITITSATSILGIHRYRNQPLRRLRRRLGR